MVTTSRPKTTLRHLIIGFTSRANLSENTRDFYSIVLRNFEWYARSQGWPGPEAITRDHIRDFLDYVATEAHRWPAAARSPAKKAAPATIHHYGRVVKSLFNWAEAEEYLKKHYVKGMKLDDAVKLAIKCLAESEEEKSSEIEAYALEAKEGIFREVPEKTIRKYL